MDICPPFFFYVSIYAQDKLHGLSDRLDKHLIRASRVRQETEQQAANLKVSNSSRRYLVWVKIMKLDGI